MLTDHDIYLFKQGLHGRLYEKMGCQLATHDGVAGAYFSVWAPNARAVSVMGDFNQWDPAAHPLQARHDASGVWQGFVPAVQRGEGYKYRIVSQYGDHTVDKADPFGNFAEIPPSTASRAWSFEYDWQDAAWMGSRRQRNALNAPMSIYEVHIGSWRRPEGGRMLTYRELAEQLVDYVCEMGFTHVEFLPITEHPFYGSWGYQAVGLFSSTSRYGTPEDLMYLIDRLHQREVGVILDWVPSHFPNDAHGLAQFDGTSLFEHADPKQGYHPEWKSHIFNYGRHEVRAFLISSALFWLDKFHFDGIRVDAVASMLYLDYGRQPGEWIPNEHGGRENLDAVKFLRDLNTAVYRDYPDVQTIAEESTAWPMVSRPVYLGGLGFGLKWNMGWMHDILHYLQTDPIYRKYHHDQLTFSIWYAFAENFVLPLSHDEVVYGKGSLAAKMPGDTWQKFANLRALFGFQWAHPGKKLLFMGGEFGQLREWTHDDALEWHLLERAEHAGLRRWVGDLNRVYREHHALFDVDFAPSGFDWLDCRDAEASVVAFLRKSAAGDQILVVCNFTPIPRHNYVLGVPAGGAWREMLNSDAPIYGGSGIGNFGRVDAAPVPAQHRMFSLTLSLPPLAVLYLKREPADD